MLVAGDEVAGWTVELLLDDGPMSATFRVMRDGEFGALKVLHLRDPAFAERLMRAATTLVAIDHANLVPVRGIIDVQSLPAVLSDYIDGPDLARWIGRGRQDLGETLRVFHGIIAGLAAAHDAGLVHRNLKPSKVLLATEEGRLVPKINDFLLGKVQVAEGQALTQMGTTFGTPQYMSPEQFRGAHEVDARGDLFAAGCLLYEMTCGVRPFTRSDLMGAYDAASNARYEHPTHHRPDMPDAVVALINQLLKPDADDRPPDGRAVLQRLESEQMWALIAPESVGRSTIVAMDPFTEEELAELAAAEATAKKPPPADLEPPPEPEPEPSPAPLAQKTIDPLRPSEVPTAEAPVRPQPERARTLDPREVFVSSHPSGDPRMWALLGIGAVTLLGAAAALGYFVASSG